MKGYYTDYGYMGYTLIGDNAAMALDKVLKKYGVSFLNTKGKRSNKVLGSYSQGYGIAKAYGEDGLEYIFSIIENSGWGQETNGYARDIFTRLRVIYSVHADKREATHEFLSNNLRKFDPNVFRSLSVAKYPDRYVSLAISLYMEDMLFEAKVIDKAIYKESVEAKDKRKN